MDGLRDWAYLVDNGYGYYGGDQQGQQECDHETKLYDQISQSIIGITPTFKNILNSKFKNEYAHIGLTEHRLQVTWGRVCIPRDGDNSCINPDVQNQKEAKLARLLGDKCPDNKDKLLKVQERGANSLKEMYDEVSRIANEDDGDDEQKNILWSMLGKNMFVLYYVTTSAMTSVVSNLWLI